MDKHGFYRVAAATPRVRVANPEANANEILALLRTAAEESCELVVFPELCLTGYTCADLFGQETLLEAAIEQLERLAVESAEFFEGLAFVGLPIRCSGGLYNVAAAVQDGSVRGLVPKQHLPTYKEFYERRWFQPGNASGPPLEVPIRGEAIPLSTQLLFSDLRGSAPKPLDLVVGVEICEDLWVPIPPSSRMAQSGATVLVNLSASNDLTSKADYRRELVVGQSGRCIAGYVYASCGVTESTTDVVFGGHSLIAENGALLAEANRFERHSQLIVADLDIERLLHDRAVMTTFRPTARRDEFQHVAIGAKQVLDGPLRRPVPAHPFVPAASERLAERCAEIFHIQTAALAKRIETVQPEILSIGVSGGLDSTLALLVTIKTLDLLGLERGRIHGITMPGFGTSERTRTNATQLMRHVDITSDTIDIRQLCLDTFVGLGHKPFGIDPSGLSLEQFTQAISHAPRNVGDLGFENVQARIRTLLLMSRGFVIGTGDLSELALGWCTYNADHMSMYNVNVSIPKTLVRFLVRWAADNEFSGVARDVLHSIADTQISPELLPITPDGKIQNTEEAVGPYELHDFFLYHMLRFGYGPGKILRLARQAKFSTAYSEEDVRHWLAVFYQRFFGSQFKRSCLPDGPKVGTVSLSPRGDWRMPSDADASAWLKELESAGSVPPG